MNRLRVLLCCLVVTLALCTHLSARADSWRPPTTEITTSANGRFRVTVVPRSKSDPSPIARVERQVGADQWQMVWQKPLVNDIAPTEVLLADDGSYLVTFDNWHSIGYGDDVVVIYDRHGNLVRKLSLEQILPKDYALHLPRTVSSRHWGRGHRLVDADTHVELQVVEPGWDEDPDPKRNPLRIRLADGVVLKPGGKAWSSAVAKATELERKRAAAWKKLRQVRTAPLLAPTSNDIATWRTYMFEIRDRISAPEEFMSGVMLAPAGEKEWGGIQAAGIARTIERWDASQPDKRIIFASPTSDDLARALATALEARGAGSMKGLELVFVGTAAEGQQVAKAARASGASVLVIDRTKQVPPGKPLPAVPPDYWFDGIY
jgi:hypothetical protein